MAYITSEQTKEIRNSLKAAFPRKDGWKFSVRKESGNLEVRVEVLESPLRFSVCDRGYFSLPSWSSSIEDGEYENAEVLRQILDIVNLVGKENANFDKSDSMSEYFHVGYYTTVTIGNYDAPVLYTGLEIEEADVEGLTKYNVHTALRIRSKVNPSIVRELYNTYGDTYKIITKGNSNITIIPSQFKYWEIVELVDLQAQFEKQQKEIESLHQMM